jgi:AraC-like DNA-binding protein
LKRLDAQAASLAGLFDFIEDFQFWVKDTAGRYRAVNRGFLLNYSLSNKADALGKTDFDFSPSHLASQFHLDDERVLAGEPVLNRVEVVGRFDHTAVWCVTNKVPLRNTRGQVVGTAGITRPLTDKMAENVVEDLAIARVLARLRECPTQQYQNAMLAKLAGLSVRAFERRFRKLFRLTPQHYIRRLRVRLACQALVYSGRRLADIAVAHGFADQSHFGREFRRETGMSPCAYRKRYRPPER